MVNGGIVFVPLDIAQQALNVENSVSLIAVKLNPGYEENITESIKWKFSEKRFKFKSIFLAGIS